MIQAYGGMKSSLTELDFKYIQDTTRIMWSSSVIKNMKRIVDLISSISYEDFTYEGPYYYRIDKLKQMTEEEQSTEKFAPQESNFEFHDYDSVNISKEYIDLFRQNIIKYNFFGGIVFELLNDRYTRVNLHKYLDPTSDIDVQISLNTDFLSKLVPTIMKKMKKEDEYGYEYHHHWTLVYNDEHGILKINPFYNEIINFIYDNLLVKLNELDLIFENSLPFEDEEYSDIDSHVKNDNLSYKSNIIGQSNAKLISYIDGNLQTFRIQLVLKLKNEDLEIVDHFFEFLINDSLRYDSKTISNTINILNIEDKTYHISSLNKLFYDNLKAYKERKYLIIGTTEDKRHKAFNHIFRIIYLFDIIKKYPEIYNNIPQIVKNNIRKRIDDYIDNSYIFYVYVNGQNIYKKIETKYIMKAFESIFMRLTMGNRKYSDILRTVNISEDEMYESLSHFFGLNSPSLRRLALSSPMDMNFNAIEREQPTCNIEIYRTRIRELENTLRQLEDTLRQSSINESKLEPDERKTIVSEIEKTKRDFDENLEMFHVDEEGRLRGGKRSNKRNTQKKYKKLNFKKYNARKTKMRK